MARLLHISALAMLTFTGCELFGFHPIFGADIMLADLTPVARVSGAWEGQGTAVAANIILPTSTVTDRLTEISDRCTIFEGVTEWQSHEGRRNLELTSDLQQAIGIYDTTSQRYVLSGLAATPAFGASGAQLEVTDPAADETLATVPAPPPIGAAADILGAPAGLATSFRAPAGAFDVVIVFAGGTGPMAGQSGAMCEYRPEDMDTNGDWSEIPLVDAATIDALQDRGIMIETVSAAYHREEIVEGIFDEPIAVHAGRMVQIEAADLEP